jgi:hypothetical protein
MRPDDIDAEQVDRFLAGRLRGRPVPADLYRLVQLQLAGSVQYTRLIEPGQNHPLVDSSYLNDDDRADKGIMANVAGIEAVLAHTAQIAHGEDDSLIGYWMHPGETGDVLIRLDSEGDLSVLEAHTLIGALDATASDPVLRQALAAEDGRPVHGPRVDPLDVREAAEDAERRRLYADVIDRIGRAAPDPDLVADGDRLVGLIGADLDGLSSVLVTIGAAEQAGRYDVRAVDPHGLVLTFLPGDRLASVMFYASRYRGRLPRGLLTTDTRAKLGADQWRDGPLRLVVYYDRDGNLSRVLADHLR